MTTVVVFGTFDLLHPGHRAMLEQAARHGDHLVVVVARDEVVAHYKRRLPTQNENERVKAVRLCEVVSDAVLGDSLENQGTFSVLSALRPDIVAFGYDQQQLENVLKSQEVFRDRLKTVTLDPFKPDIYKTSLLRRDDSV